MADRMEDDKAMRMKDDAAAAVTIFIDDISSLGPSVGA